MLRVRAQALARAKSIPHEDFKASAGWVRRFLKRKGLSFRRRTTLCQRLPPDYTDKVLSFQKYVIGLRREHKYIFSQIANANQIPVWFGCPESCTVELKGKKSVFVRTTGAERQRCTVMLCVTADGLKLPPYVILKRKTIPKGVFPKGIVVRAQEKGWMDDELVLDWVKSVWEKRPGAMLARRSLLVLDSFRDHLTGRVKERLRGIRTDMAVIPGGLTGMLQPLDSSYSQTGGQQSSSAYGSSAAFTGSSVLGGSSGSITSAGVRTNEYRKSSLGPTAPIPTSYGRPSLGHLGRAAGGPGVKRF
ncbi:hypothetical protein V5799_009125 [Amblyomma americanum]|uniref:HTH CENPB-type domain-containing protein n=1 Tax=Amblyomma americanum TaxID=6943 RepID=A0AAQ4FCN0_AMBAM